MRTKRLIIPVLVVALVTAAITPPVHAELVTITLVLAAAFTTAVATTEIIKSNDNEEMASAPIEKELIQQASLDYTELAPAP